jgi:aspartate/methionine/tyrosine aminotransferase
VKAASLPGLRTGWIIDADAERRRRAIDARGYFTVSGSPVLEAITVHALRHRDVVLGRSRSVTSRNLATLAAFMENHGDVMSWVRPQGGTIAFPWFADGRNSRAFCSELAGQGVLVVPGDCFGAPKHVRVGLGAEADGFAEAIASCRALDS